MFIPIVREMFTGERAMDGRKGKMDNGPVQGRVRTGPPQIPREGLQQTTGPQIRTKTGGIVQILTGILRIRQMLVTGRVIPVIITGQDPRQTKQQAGRQAPVLPVVNRNITI